MNKRMIVSVVGLGLSLSGCSAGKADPEEMSHNPPAPLPTWDEVKSSHPEGATNPPSPVLLVSPDGLSCYKQWVGGMVPVTPETGDRVGTCAPEGCGTPIECPQPRAQELLDAAKAKTPPPGTPL